MAVIDSRGLVDDGSSGLTVAGTVVVTTQTFATTTVQGAGAVVTLGGPGVYLMSASAAGVTGSVPLASAYPGAHIVVRDLGAYAAGAALTGSAEGHATARVFTVSGSNFTPTGGTLLKIPSSGSVMLVSDGATWSLTNLSGSAGFSGLNL